MAGARAIIGPHAGYAYSGETAAYAYKQVYKPFGCLWLLYILKPK